MKLSDFLIRGRHLFGFLVPGVMWIALILLLSKRDPLHFIEEGNSPLLRAIALLALGYIVGFSLQTILFRLIADPMKRRIGTPKTVKPLEVQIERVLTAKLPEKETEWLLYKDHLPTFCKYYILEYSNEMKNIVLEKEDDINFLAANIIPGPLLLISYTLFKGVNWWLTAIAILLALGLVVFLIERLSHYINREKEEWYELFLVLQLEREKKTRP